MRHLAIAAILALSFGTGLVVLADEEHHADKKDEKKAPATTQATTQASAKAINKYCATEGKGHAIDPDVTYVYQGKIIGFCCADCIEVFKKDPEKYMKTLE